MPKTSVRQLLAWYFLSRRQVKLRMRTFAFLPLAVMLALASCSATPAYYHTATGMCRDYTRSYPLQASFTCYVTFAPTVTYTEALRMLTDVGMQPSLHCWSENGFALWQPTGQRELFAQWHSLIVLPNTDGPNPFTGPGRCQSQSKKGRRIRYAYQQYCTKSAGRPTRCAQRSVPHGKRS